jgi:hypothetical protein
LQQVRLLKHKHTFFFFLTFFFFSLRFKVDSTTLLSTRSAAAIDPASLCNGDGFVVSGTIHEIRNHSYQDTNTKRYYRYLALVIDIDEDYLSERVFVAGVEKEKVIAYSHNVSRTGHLTTSYQKTKVTLPNAVSVAEFSAKVSKNNSSGSLPLGIYDEGAPKLHPAVTNRFEFWGDAQTLKSAALTVGTKLHLKTRGNSHIIDVCAKESGNYTGENVGASFADKVAAANTTNAAQAKAKQKQPELEGVAEEEWD